jgi:Tol biopolymer transport system component
MSPEQAAGQEIDARSDLFSLGAVLYEMATGAPPFKAETSAAMLKTILTRQPESPTCINPKVPYKLEKIILKSLVRDRGLRYQSAAELQTDLERLKRETEPRGSRWRTALLLSVSLATLLLAGVATYNKMTVRPAKPRGTSTVTRLTTGADVYQAAISPDGRHAAYLESDKDHVGFSLWLQSIATSARTELLPPEGYEGLSFSPEGAYLYYTWIGPNSSTRSLYRVSVSGGIPEEVLANVPPQFRLSSDGSSVAYLSSDPQDGRDILLVRSIDGSIENVIAKLAQGAAYSDPAWSPDSKLLAVAEHAQGDTLLSHILVVPLEGGRIRRITLDEFCIINSLEWLKDGTGLIATAVGRKVVSKQGVEYEGERPELWMFPYPAGTPYRITNDFFHYAGGASISADSTTLAAVASDSVSAIGCSLPSGSGARGHIAGRSSRCRQGARLGRHWQDRLFEQCERCV